MMLMQKVKCLIMGASFLSKQTICRSPTVKKDFGIEINNSSPLSIALLEQKYSMSSLTAKCNIYPVGLQQWRMD